MMTSTSSGWAGERVSERSVLVDDARSRVTEVLTSWRWKLGDLPVIKPNLIWETYVVDFGGSQM